MKEEFLYLCDRNACEICNPECCYTSDLNHALNFTCEPTEEEKRDRFMLIKSDPVNLVNGYFEKDGLYKMNLIEEIARSSTEASLYEMLAEESAELSSAASKYARFLRKEQPVKEGLTKEILLEHVIEEYADVDVSMTVAAAKTEDEFQAPFVWNKVNHMVMKKIERWRDRLNKKKEEASND